MYLLDANVFIQAKNTYYSFDVCPGFWDSLIGAHEGGSVGSIVPVKSELEIGKDELADWVRANVPANFFASEEEESVVSRYREVVGHVQQSPAYLDYARADFLSGADGWLIAYASTHNLHVVTQEQLDPNIRKRVPIPNVAQHFGVPFINTFEMLKALKVQYTWQGE